MLFQLPWFVLPVDRLAPDHVDYQHSRPAAGRAARVATTPNKRPGANFDNRLFRFVTGSRFADKVRATGASFVPLAGHQLLRQHWHNLAPCGQRSGTTADNVTPTRRLPMAVQSTAPWRISRRTFRPGNDEDWAVSGPTRPTKTPLELRLWCGAPSGFRTPDPLIKSQLLYQLS